jgi:hypothetical protein
VNGRDRRKSIPPKSFDEVMSLSLKKAVTACILLMLASGAGWTGAVPPGFLEGHLKITSLGAVEHPDAMPRQTVTAEMYSEYPLIVLSRDEKKEVAHVTADGNGNYRAALPPGDYILDVQDRAAKHLRAKPQLFSIVSKQTVHVDMNVIIGFR